MRRYLTFLFSLLALSSWTQTLTDIASLQNINHIQTAANHWANGGTFYDFNNDGWDDIYFSCLNSDHLFKNNQGLSFIDVSIAAGIYNPYNSQASAWEDINNDGWLDLYVINYEVGVESNSSTKAPGDPIEDAFYLFWTSTRRFWLFSNEALGKDHE